MEKVDFSASLRLYSDDPVDKVILDWLATLPRREEENRTCRRGLNREVRQALYAYAKKRLGSTEKAGANSRRRRVAPAAQPLPARPAASSGSAGSPSAHAPGGVVDLRQTGDAVGGVPGGVGVPSDDGRSAVGRGPAPVGPLVRF